VVSGRLLEDAKNHNARNKYLNFEMMTGFLKEMGCKHKSDGKAQGWVFLPLAKARRAWAARAGGEWDWLTPEVTDWGEQPSVMDA